MPLGDESWVFKRDEAMTSALFVPSFASVSRLARLVAGGNGAFPFVFVILKLMQSQSGEFRVGCFTMIDEKS